MWIRRAEVTGYGRLVERKFEFAQRLNCVYGDNEAGKSTLQSFLVSMLYGQAKAGLRNRTLDEAHDRYLPGRAPMYGGQIVLVLESGRQLAVKRSFADTADGITLVDERTGQAVHGEYARSLKEYQFVQKEGRIDKGTYEKVFIIGHNSVAKLEAASDGTVSDRLVELADTGSESGGAEKARALLAKALDAIGTDRAPTRPYRRNQAALKAARARYEEIKAARDQYSEALGRRAQLAGEIESGEALLSAEHAVLAQSRHAALDAIDKEAAALAAEGRRLAASEGVPLDITEKSFGIAKASLESAERRYAEAARAQSAAAGALAEAQNAIATLGNAALIDDAVLRAAEDAIAEFLERREALDGILEQHDRIGKEMQGILARWGGDVEALEVVTPGEEALLASAGERKAALHEESARATERIASAGAARGRGALITGAAGALTVLLAVAAGLAAIFAGAATRWPIVAGAGALAVVAAGITASKLRRAKSATAEIALLEEGRSAAAREIEKVDTGLAAICGRFKGRSLEELARAVRDFHDDQRRIDQMSREAARLESDVEKRRVALAEAQEKAVRAASAARVAFRPDGGEAPADEGLWQSDALDAAASPARAREAFRTFWDQLRAGRGVKETAARVRCDADKAAAALDRARLERDKASETLEGLLRRGGVTEPAILAALLEQRARLSEIRARLRELSGRGERVLSGRTRDAIAADADSCGDCDAKPLMPEGDLARAEREFEEKRGALAAKKSELAAANATVAEGLKNLPDIADIEDRIGVLEERGRLQDHHRRAIERAIDVIAEAAGAFHGEVYPKIEAAFTAILSQVTLGAHDDVRLWSDDEGGAPKLKISVVDKDRGIAVQPEELSQGTLEQVFLCARLALAEALSTADPVPVMLDDPFINYDAGRLKAAVAYLACVAGRRQVFLFTCQQDVRDLAQAAGGGVITL